MRKLILTTTLAFAAFAFLKTASVRGVELIAENGIAVRVQGFRPDETHLRISITRERLVEELKKRVSESFPLPRREFGNFVVWRNLRLVNAVATVDQKFTQVTLSTPDSISFSALTNIGADIRYEYKHEWVGSEVKKIFWKWKNKVPVVRSEWRTTTGRLDTGAAVSASYQIDAVKDGANVHIRLRPLADKSSVKVSEIRVNGINKHLEQITRKIRDSLAQKAVHAVIEKRTVREHLFQVPNGAGGGLGELQIKEVKVAVKVEQIVLDVFLNKRI
ncbi:hypothetical protein [Humisphaera borealis]|uniref:DUF541 domain-containing protein n=1 Tax=Humisphaera borealis TaxID=2807512 RepID=A0A7M2X1E5_9BACT|nr:hypothetical protein [Humisphaera borealis]QOV90951.1 hypothetical protein IPV69_06205 [Humisphaera borealis]